eukprot:UN28075
MGWDKIKKYVKQEALRFGLKPNNIICMSAKKDVDIFEVFYTCRFYLQQGQQRDIYVVGTVNVGKSSFLNRLIEAGVLLDNEKRKLTTSLHPGTTLNCLSFTLPNYPGCRVYDTPGVIHENAIATRLTPKEIFQLHIKRKIRPITYRLIPGKCIMIGAMCRLELVEGNNMFLLCLYQIKLLFIILMYPKRSI